jgi:hypothetical protein
MSRLEGIRLTVAPRVLTLAGACILAALVLALVQSPTGSAASLVAKDGKIHACFKAKGKAKGTLRVVRSARARCPRGWRKTAWTASAPAVGPQGGQGPQGAAGAAGSAGHQGPTGATGPSASVVVDALEDEVSGLLAKVQGLESVLAGVDHAELAEAIQGVTKVAALESILDGLDNSELKEAVQSVTKVQALESILDGVGNSELKEAIQGVAKVEALETILSGVTNSELLEAVGLAPVVGALCDQTEELNGVTTGLRSTLGALNTLLNTILLGFSPVTLPTALPPFSCPAS